MAATVY